jgi:hypothetical protein
LHCAAQRKGKEPLFDTAAIDGILEKVGSKHCKPSLDREALAQELDQACNHFWIWEACEREPSKKQLIGQLKGFQRIIARLQKNLSSPDGVGGSGLARALCNTDPRIIDAWHAVIANALVLEKAANEALARFDEGSSPVTEPSISVQEQRFAQEFLVDDDPKAAAVRAGYAPEAAEMMGQRNICLPRVKDIIISEKRRNDPSSARRWLIGRKLPEIYGRYFTGNPYAVSRPSSGETKPGGPPIRFILKVLSLAKIRNSKGAMYAGAGIEEIFQKERPQTLGIEAKKKTRPPFCEK